METLFTLDFTVRDYECDLQGIVNNSVYGNYLEHARHEFLKTIGLDFAELTQAGVFLVVTHTAFHYRKPLKSGDAFSVSVAHQSSSKIRGEFLQRVIRQSDDALMLEGTVRWASIDDKGRPIKSLQVAEALHNAAHTSPQL